MFLTVLEVLENPLMQFRHNVAFTAFLTSRPPDQFVRLFLPGNPARPVPHFARHVPRIGREQLEVRPQEDVLGGGERAHASGGGEWPKCSLTQEIS